MDKGKTWSDLVREYFPNASYDEVETILWEHTGFPAFWSTPADGLTPVECCRKQLQELKDSLAAKTGADL